MRSAAWRPSDRLVKPVRGRIEAAVRVAAPRHGTGSAIGRAVMVVETKERRTGGIVSAVVLGTVLDWVVAEDIQLGLPGN